MKELNHNDIVIVSGGGNNIVHYAVKGAIIGAIVASPFAGFMALLALDDAVAPPGTGLLAFLMFDGAGYSTGAVLGGIFGALKELED